jgi:Leucine-rich repeat (LRR) protein
LLNENFWRSEIPDVFQDYEALDFFDISNTMVFGSLPSTLFSIPTLRVAYFSNCSLTGTIPSSYSDSPLLRDLFLDGNRLTGEVPSVPAGKLTNLNELLLHRTQLTGTMPESVCDLRKNSILDDLWSDCGGSDPEIECDFPSCCNRCFEGGASSRRLVERQQS